MTTDPYATVDDLREKLARRFPQHADDCECEDCLNPISDSELEDLRR